MSEMRNQQSLMQAFLISGLAFFTIIFLVYGAAILVPLAVALLIWFFLNALAEVFLRVKLKSRAMPRPVALLLSFIVVAIVGAIVVDIIASNLAEISARVGDIHGSLMPWIEMIAKKVGMSNSEVLNTILSKIGIEKLLTNIVSSMASFFSQLSVVLIYVIFLLIEQQFFDLKLNALVRDDERKRIVRDILNQIAADIQDYMWIMTLVGAMTAVLSYAVMKWMGLGQSGFWAFLIFVLNFIPTIGSILGTALPCVYAFVQFQALGPTFALLILIGIIQFVLGNVVQPRMAGRSLNISQFAVVLSLFAWGAVWGVTGMFLAVPLTSILMIVFANFKLTRPVAVLLSQDGRIDEGNS